MKKITKQFQENYKGSPGKKMDPKSETQPDQHLSIRQLLERHTKGTLAGVPHHEGHYFGDAPIKPIQDITELKERRDDLSAQKELLEQRAQEETESALEARKQALEAKKQSEQDQKILQQAKQKLKTDSDVGK